MIKIEFNEGDSIGKFSDTIAVDMNFHVERFDAEMKKLRTGRAHTSFVEDIMVNCYGSQMKLSNIASISAPEAQLIVVQPWDQGLIPSIEKALSGSDLGVAPVNDGKVIRINLPPMTAEKRNKIIKSISKRLEECKVSVRNVRKNFNNFIRDTLKSKNISQDTAKRLEENLQKETNKFIELAEKVYKKKEKDVLTI